MTVERLGAMVACVVVGTALVAGFAISGSPQHARARALDERRVDDLELIAEGMVHRNHPAPNALPRNFEVTRPDGSDATHDPATGVPYPYHRIDAKHYQLCATFSTAQTEPGWTHRGRHPAGLACYRFGVDNTWSLENTEPER